MVKEYRNNNKNIDLIIVIGLQLDDKWHLKPDILARLNNVIDLYMRTPGVKILVSGSYSITFDWKGISPKALECKLMKQYLVQNGIPSRKIISESRAKDSIGNVYYSKKIVRKYPEFKKIVVVCATQHQPRIKFLFNKFFGPEYCIDYHTIRANENNEKVLSEEQEIKDEKIFLSKVGTGYEDDFRHQLYNGKFYTKSRLLK